MKKKEYYLFINGEKVYVSKEVYLAYWRQTNKENYQEHLIRKNGVLSFCQLDHDGNFQDNLIDESVDVEKLVETKMQIERLYEALNELNDEEREIIDALFFRDESLKEVGRTFNISAPAMMKRRNKILLKLRSILKEF